MVYREEANKRIKKTLKGKIYSFESFSIKGNFRIDSITFNQYREVTIRLSVDAEWWTVGGHWYSPPLGFRKSKSICNREIKSLLFETIQNLLIMIGVNPFILCKKDIHIKWDKFNKQ